MLSILIPWLIALVIAIIIFECGRLLVLYIRTKTMEYRTVPFETPRRPGNKVILVCGDSTAYGLGSSSQGSLAGWINRHFPEYDIVNVSVPSIPIRKMLPQIAAAKSRISRADAVVVCMGGIDIVTFSAPATSRAAGLAMLQGLKEMTSGKIIWFFPENIGAVPMFRFPLSPIFGWQSRRLHKVFRQLATENGISYIDLIEQHKIPRRTEPGRYSSDLIHPNDHGYRLWFEKMRQHL